MVVQGLQEQCIKNDLSWEGRASLMQDSSADQLYLKYLAKEGRG